MINLSIILLSIYFGQAKRMLRFKEYFRNEHQKFCIFVLKFKINKYGRYNLY